MTKLENINKYRYMKNTPTIWEYSFIVLNLCTIWQKNVSIILAYAASRTTSKLLEILII